MTPGLALAAALAAAPGTAALERARALYADLKYEKCIELAAGALKSTTHRATRADLLVTQGLCEAQLRQTPEARLSFERAQLELPGVALPRLAPPSARELFEAARPPPDSAPSEVAPAPPPPPPPEPEPVPAPALVPEPPPALDPPPAIAVSAQPPEVEAAKRPWPGRLGLGALAVVAGCTSGALLGAAHRVAAQHNAEPYWMTRQSLAGQAGALQTASFISLVVSLAALAAVGVHEVWLHW